jgi:hypothetical protein
MIVAGIVLAGLILPASAFGHAGAAEVSCTGAQFTFTNFAAGSNTVHYLVTVNGAPVARGDYTLDQNGGRSGAVHIPMNLTGTPTVQAYAWWGPAGVVNGHTRPQASPPLASESLVCAPPAPVTPPAAPAAPAPAAPPPTVGGGFTPSPIRSARLRVPGRCVAKAARVTVLGRAMRDVTFSIKGRRPVTRSVAPGRQIVTALVPLRRRGPARQTVRARVRFRNGAAPMTLTRLVARCAQATARPPFTG